MRMMFVVVACVSAGWLVSPAARAEQVEVFILAGQSNMDGRGHAKDLDAAAKGPVKDVEIWYVNPQARSNGFEPLATGFAIAPGYKGKVPSDRFGPELGFGQAMAEKLPGKHIVIIKCSKGGTSIAKDWNPQTGPLYPLLLKTVREALDALDKRGDTYTVHALCWHQGESDAHDTAQEYQDRLTNFMTRVREGLKMPDLPIIIGAVYDNQKRDGVRAGQKAFTEADKHAALVTVEGLKTADGGTHFDSPSVIELGRRLAQAAMAMSK